MHFSHSAKNNLFLYQPNDNVVSEDIKWLNVLNHEQNIYIINSDDFIRYLQKDGTVQEPKEEH